MDYALFKNSNLLNNSSNNSNNSENNQQQHLQQQQEDEEQISWDIPSDSSMDPETEEYFGWNPLKIVEESNIMEQQQQQHHQQQEQISNNNNSNSNNNNNNSRPVRKRKLQINYHENNSSSEHHQHQNSKIIKSPSSTSLSGFKIIDENNKINKSNKSPTTVVGAASSTVLQNGGVRMPAWQVEDITELNGEIDSSLSLGSDLANNPYNEILTISGLTVFKQEAPSPTNDGTTASQSLHHQIIRQSRNQSPTTSGQILVQNNNSPNNNQIDDSNNSQSMINNTINQLLTQSVYTNLQNAIDANLSSTSPQDNYNNVTSSNYSFTEDCRFQYVLAAATSIATKVNEDTLTYLNQGQSYEIKLKKLGDLSTYRGKSLKTIVRMCFHERRLQYMEKEQMTSWQNARPGDRILEVDVPLSYGAFDIVQPQNALNIIQFNWDPTKEVGVYIKVNCISTEFTPKKHGGEKGVPFRIQVETYQNGDNLDSVRLHAAACQIKVFKLKGADRKHKQDREKIMKRPLAEQEKYQPSYECTVLNDIPIDAVLGSPPIVPIATNAEISGGSGKQAVLTRKETVGDEILSKQIVASINKQTLLDSHNAGAITTTNSSGILIDKKQHLEDSNGGIEDDQIVSTSAPHQTTKWLVQHRFEKYVETFSSFSGADMLRMSREDLIQICGQADGIRLYNCVHLKTIMPKLKIYVCRERTTIFNAIFLLTYTSCELLEKLSGIMGIGEEQVQDLYVEGPHGIHVHLTNDVVRHIKDETMFSVEILQESDGGYVFLLKRTVK